QPRVQAALTTEYQRELLPDALLVADDVEAKYPRRTGGRHKHRRQYLAEGRLARAVRAEQPVHLAGGHLKLKPAQCFGLPRLRAEPSAPLPVDPAQLPHLDGGT